MEPLIIGLPMILNSTVVYSTAQTFCEEYMWVIGNAFISGHFELFKVSGLIYALGRTD
jgi:hypothetical protein